MKIVTWNINSVRLRIAQVEKFLAEEAPEVLALQEIKCLEDNFPAKALEKAGYAHQAVHGQSGYHGVAIISKVPFTDVERRDFCDKGEARHVAVSFENGVRLHNFYIPAGGDEPDPKVNDKFAHKLGFLEELAEWTADFDPAQKKRVGW